MTATDVAKDSTEIAYEERMDRLLGQLNKAAQKGRTKRRNDMLISVLVIAALAVAIYFGLQVVTDGGNFTDFIATMRAR
ncbi:MAG TPA: hypothetical protein PLZ55_02945 [bacterium]|nr:hypothetical protein [bacterium]HQO36363.1 hypothetical protein [bacterium]HQP99074.1 hypothetical protein [bacterium]